MGCAAHALDARIPHMPATVAAHLADVKAHRLRHVDHAALRVIAWPCVEAQAAEFFLDLTRDDLRAAIRCFRLQAVAQAVEQIESAIAAVQPCLFGKDRRIVGVQLCGEFRAQGASSLVANSVCKGNRVTAKTSSGFTEVEVVKVYLVLSAGDCRAGLYVAWVGGVHRLVGNDSTRLSSNLHKKSGISALTLAYPTHDTGRRILQPPVQFLRLDPAKQQVISKLVRYVDCIWERFVIVLMYRHSYGDAGLDRVKFVAQSHHLGPFAVRLCLLEFLT
ncbi:hypothetical protein BZM26_00080 [Paraburkholderia strydomiana]|nr:hypothetical protein BZM26_00080 [Paraburkholderia strydomiana]